MVHTNTEFSFSAFVSRHGLEDTVRLTCKMELFLYHTASPSGHIKLCSTKKSQKQFYLFEKCTLIFLCCSYKTDPHYPPLPASPKSFKVALLMPALLLSILHPVSSVIFWTCGIWLHDVPAQYLSGLLITDRTQHMTLGSDYKALIKPPLSPSHTTHLGGPAHTTCPQPAPLQGFPCAFCVSWQPVHTSMVVVTMLSSGHLPVYALTL